MNIVPGLIAMALALLSNPQPAVAQPASGDHGEELPMATIDSTRQFDFTSPIDGEAYRIQVFIPNHPPPPAGYPVVYVLDGNVLFGTYASAVRTKALARETEPAIVVGIASGEGEHRADRALDFTISQRTAREKAIVTEMAPDQNVGGAEAFFRVIQEEIRPHVDKIAAVDEARAVLLGWSLGGLFVTHTLLTHPDAFKSYIAISPSIWFNERAVLREIPAFKARVAQGHLRPRFFLAAGGREGEIPPFRLKAASSPRAMVAEMRYYNMVRNPVALKDILTPCFRKIDAPLRFRLFARDTHNSIPWSMVNPAVDFAFPIVEDARP